MIVLAFDTAHDRTAVAVTGPRIDSMRDEPMERGHAERLIPLIDATLSDAGVPLETVDRIAVTIGPGSFTGIRVALAAARGLGLALDKPVIGVGSLPALAASLPEPSDGPVLAAVDARRGEIYAALYDRGGRELIAPFAGEAAAVLDRVGDDVAVVVGSGAAIIGHAAAVAGRRVPTLHPIGGPDPRAIARLGAASREPHAPAEPLYVRPPDAKPQAAPQGVVA